MEVKTTIFPRITKVWAKNFRSIESLELELEPLTVLVGPNASGKSNIVDVLRFVSDAVRNDLDSALTSRKGDHAARRSHSRRTFTDITIGFVIALENSSIEYEFVMRLYRDGRHKVVNEAACVKLADHKDSEDWRIEIKGGRMVSPRLRRRPQEMPNALYDAMYSRSMVASATSDGTELAFPFSGFPFATALISTVSFDDYLSIQRSLTESASFLAEMRFYHIFPDALREPQLMASKYPLEERGENLASVIGEMKRKNSSYFPELVTALSQVVPGIQDVSVTAAGGYLVVRLLHGGNSSGGKGIWLDASQESDGTPRTLGLLAALYQDPTPPFITIEEPELTIHPGALAVLADVILETSRRSSLLVTTHSPELLDRLPIDCIRSVDAEDGATRVGVVAEHQKAAVAEGLFSAGELHRMEGLQPAFSED
jgi:predicted ATPase